MAARKCERSRREAAGIRDPARRLLLKQGSHIDILQAKRHRRGLVENQLAEHGQLDLCGPGRALIPLEGGKRGLAAGVVYARCQARIVRVRNIDSQVQVE